MARAVPVEIRGWLADRRFRAGRRIQVGAQRNARCGAAADRLPLPLRLRHADRGRGLHHLVHVQGRGELMLSWPILSVTTFLPLVGALLIMLMRADGEAEKRNARWIALWTTLITFAISLILVW